MFLTWKPATMITDRLMCEKLYYLNWSNANQLKLRYKYYTPSTTYGPFTAQTIAAETMQVYECIVSPAKLNLHLLHFLVFYNVVCFDYNLGYKFLVFSYIHLKLNYFLAFMCSLGCIWPIKNGFVHIVLGFWAGASTLPFGPVPGQNGFSESGI